MVRFTKKGTPASCLMKLMGKRSREKANFVVQKEGGSLDPTGAPVEKESAGPTDCESCSPKGRSHPWDKHLALSKVVKRKTSTVDQKANGTWEEKNGEDGEISDSPHCVISDTSDTGNSSEEEDLDTTLDTTLQTNSDESVSSKEEEKSLPKSPTSVVDFVSLSSRTYLDVPHRNEVTLVTSEDEIDSGPILEYGGNIDGLSSTSIPVENADVPFDEIPFDECDTQSRELAPRIPNEQGTLWMLAAKIAEETKATATTPGRKENGAEEVPFDEQAPKQHTSPGNHRHNFDNKTYFSDDDSLYTDDYNSLLTEDRDGEKSLYSIASGSEDELFGLAFVANS